MRHAATERRGRDRGVVWWTIVAATIAISLTVVPAAKDPFRIPKEIESRALGIIAMATLAGGGWKRLRDGRFKYEVGLAGAICVWAAASAALSVNRSLSFDALVTVVCGAATFVAICVYVHDRNADSLFILLAAAAANAVIIALQVLNVWNPFTLSDTALQTALIGNRNDVGSYLTAPAIAAVVLAGVSSGRKRSIATVLAVVLAGGLLASQTLSAMAAYASAIITFAVIAKRRLLKPLAIAVPAALLVGAIALFALSRKHSGEVNYIVIPLKGKITALAHGNFSLGTTHRVGAFLTAWQMFERRPITGMGPGAFGYEYFPEALEVERRHPTLLSPYAERVNFSEAHNDHLQVLAQSGIVGYALFGAVLIYLGSLSFGDRHNAVAGERSSTARYLALPLAVGFAILAIGQFPLELAAPRVMFLIFGGVCCSWSHA